MNRTLLVHHLVHLFSERTIPLYCGDKHYIQSINTLPAAWLCTPRLIEVEGRKRGRATYSVELHLLESGAKLTLNERETKLDEMETLIIELFTQLSDSENIISVENLKLQPSLFRLSNRGEISITATCEVITNF